jgi:RNA recognition motif-containing protein
MEGSTLYVGNLTYSVTEEQLEELFSNYGDVKEVRIIERKGFGFVEMSSPEEAEKAKEALNETVYEGRTMRVDEARPARPKREFQRY